MAEQARPNYSWHVEQPILSMAELDDAVAANDNRLSRSRSLMNYPVQFDDVVVAQYDGLWRGRSLMNDPGWSR